MRSNLTRTSRRSPVVFAVAFTALLLACSTAARAQERDAPKVEVGVQFSSLSVTVPENYGTENLSGIGGRFSYNLNDHVALEAEGNLFANRLRFGDVSAGGRAVQVQAGVKAGKRWEKWGLFAKARPGLVSFDETVKITQGVATLPSGRTVPIAEFDFGRVTHLTMDVGGVLEFYPTRRLLVRFDAGDTLIRYGERNTLDNGNGGAIVLIPREFRPVLKAPAETKHNFQFSAGIGFRFMDPDAGGGDDASTTSSPSSTTGGRDVPRYEVGAQFTSLMLHLPSPVFGFPVISPGDPGTEPEAGFGARFTFNLNDHVALEAEGNFFPREHFPGNTTGGFPAQAQFGVKAGRRWEKFGVFAKGRPGFVSFSRVRQLVGTELLSFVDPFTGVVRQFTLGVFEDKRRTYFSTDVGGVLELYPSRRLVTRFDLGDTIIRYGTRHEQTFFLSPNFIEIAPETQHNFQFSAGIGFRF